MKIVFTISDTISVMINIGNATYPNSASDPVNQSEADPPDLIQSEDDPGWEHMRVALVAILAGVISFLTIVGNIMVKSIKTYKFFPNFLDLLL